jgi:hypothetical protein
MNSFQKLFKSNNILFGELSYYFYITKFQTIGLAHGHGLWFKNGTRFGIFINEKIKIFVDKYLTTNQSILQIEFCNSQIHQHKQTCQKISNQFVNSNIQNHQ